LQNRNSNSFCSEHDEWLDVGMTATSILGLDIQLGRTAGMGSSERGN
jgi:hypothetical protein